MIVSPLTIGLVAAAALAWTGAPLAVWVFIGAATVIEGVIKPLLAVGAAWNAANSRPAPQEIPLSESGDVTIPWTEPEGQ